MNKEEYLVRINGRWYIAKPAVTIASPKENLDTKDKILCWAGRNGAVLCFAGEEEKVMDLPE